MLEQLPLDKAPKIFAAWVSLLFASTAALLYLVDPMASLVVALILMIFALAMIGPVLTTSSVVSGIF